MTLCIAAIASNGKGIVTASDLRYDLGHTSGDGRPKFGRIHPHWAAMFAGSNVGNAPTILQNITEALAPFPTVSRKDVQRLFVQEYQAALVQEIESAVLSPFNRMTLKAFTESGPKRFTEQVYGALVADVGIIKLGIEFVVFGFDQDQAPHLFKVQDRGLVEDRKSIGFVAIGSGDAAADHHMMFHEYTTTLPLRTAAYYVCASKFFAERASLGEATHVVCLMNDGRLIGINEKAIRDLWQAEGRSHIPANVWNRLPKFEGIAGEVSPGDDLNVQLPTIGSSTKVGDWISATLTGVSGTGAVGNLTPSVSMPDAVETPQAPEEPPTPKAPTDE